ncbi:MAG: hypothetical protein Q8L10_01325 [Candidatus Moranbacteria bacterium]|nr:hypothetical protein [Candidatus Moranbacteria bacterium]
MLDSRRNFIYPLSDYERQSSSESAPDPFGPGVETSDLLARIRKGRLDGAVDRAGRRKKPVETSYVVDGVEKTAEVTEYKKFKPFDPGAKGEPPVYDISEVEKTKSAEDRAMVEKALVEMDIFSRRIAALEERTRADERSLGHMKFSILSIEFAGLSKEVLEFMQSLSLDEINKDTEIRSAFNALFNQLLLLRNHIADEGMED